MINMTTASRIAAALLPTLLSTSPSLARASEAAEDVKEVAHDVAKGAKKAPRAADDKLCPMVNGKATCAVKKGKHAVENKVDEHTK